MAVFEFFKKKKKEDVAGVDLVPELDLGAIAERPESLQPNFTGLQQNLSDRDVQLILAKLDLLNQKLDNVDKRLQFIEQVARESR